MAGVTGARELAAALIEGAAQVDALVEIVVAKSAHDMVGLVQKHASGRPGPNAPTGDYRGSWNALPVAEATGVSWSVGTDRAQAARLEYGFVGPDSLGRVFHQDPLPHMGPAYDEIAPVFEAAMAKAAEAGVTW